jgi:intermediate peptidase
MDEKKARFSLKDDEFCYFLHFPSLSLFVSHLSGRHQSPRVCVVCSFGDETHRPEITANQNGFDALSRALLSHGEAVNLFHEFGHVCHHILSRTSFQHTAGTRCALDFAEFPSQFMEHFVWDARVTPEFATHFKTG